MKSSSKNVHPFIIKLHHPDKWAGGPHREGTDIWKDAVKIGIIRDFVDHSEGFLPPFFKENKRDLWSKCSVITKGGLTEEMNYMIQ